MSTSLTDADIDLLGRDPLFAALSPKHLRAVAKAAKPLTFTEGSEIVVAGEQAGRFHLLTEGQAAVLVNGVERALLAPGASFGEVSLIDDGPRMATVCARTPVRTLSLASFHFRPLLREHPEIWEAVALRLCGLLRSERSHLPA